MAFQRDPKIKQSIVSGEVKSKKEEKKERKSNPKPIPALPINKKKNQEKVYRTYYFGKDQIKKLEKTAKRNGYPSVSAFLRDWIDSLPDEE